jgi:hypothetical protein
MPISIGQSVVAQSGSIATLTTASRNTQAAGSTFIAIPLFVTGNLSAAPVDNKSNIYGTFSPIVNNGGVGVSAQGYMSANGAGGTGHTWSMTNSGTSVAQLWIVEVLGATILPVDQTPAGSVNSSGPPYSFPVTTAAQPNEIVIAYGFSNSSSATVNYSVDGTFTKVLEVTDGATVISGCVASRVVSALGTYDALFNPSAGTTVTGFAFSLKEASAGSNTYYLGGLHEF